MLPVQRVLMNRMMEPTMHAVPIHMERVIRSRYEKRLIRYVTGNAIVPSIEMVTTGSRTYSQESTAVMRIIPKTYSNPYSLRRTFPASFNGFLRITARLTSQAMVQAIRSLTNRPLKRAP